MSSDRRELLALSGAVLAGVPYWIGEYQNRTEESDDSESDASDQRVEPEIDSATLETLVEGNTRFAFKLFDELVAAEPDADHFVSPFSISMALAMTWAGTGGETEAEMADTLHFVLEQDELHPAFNALYRELESRSEREDKSEDGNENGDDEEEGDPFELNIANALWPREGTPIHDEFRETVAAHYGAEPTPLDFGGNPEEAAETINNWVADETEEKIEELVKAKHFDEFTAMVLTNAIYFLAGWANEFDEDATEDSAFTTLDGSTGEVSMMSQTESFPYAEIDGHQVIELPYVGGETSMVVLLPADGEFEAFEADLDAERLEALLAELDTKRGTIDLPRFELEADYALPDIFRELGMELPFTKAADFSAMMETEPLFIDNILHEAVVTVDEEGTEAAAATAVIMTDEAAPPSPEFTMTVDRPFLFLLRDRPTDAVLFLGRVVDVPEEPAESE